MVKKILIAIVGLVVIVGGLVGIKALQIKALIDSGNGFQLPPEYVTSTEVTEDVWMQSLTAVGSLTAVQGVLVSTEVAGKVTAIHFDSGDTVEDGQALADLDDSTERAQLAAAEADLQLAKINLDRAQKLRETNTVAQAELDSAQASFLASSARVENLKALIAKKHLKAPFAGRLGIRQVDLGQYIGNGEPIVSLQSLDPIHVDFSFPQKWVSTVSVGMTLEMRIDSYPGMVFSGKLTAITPAIDRATRTLSLRGTLDNPEGKLLPGMFGEVAVILPNGEPKKVIPSTAILHASYGDSVFVIRENEGKKTVEQQFVRVGESRGDYVSINSGPEVGETVVSTGVFKLRQGMLVEINNDLAPKAEINPTPSDS